MTAISYIIITFILMVAAAVIVWDRVRLTRALRGLERMLDAAIAGDWQEAPPDETLRSRVEAKLADYLSASALSERRVTAQKESIQSLISDISHQTKTPLSNILLYAQLLCEQELSESGRACTAALSGQTRKLQTLIDSLVKLSRLESGILTFHPRREPLLPMLESAAGQLRPRAGEKGVALTLCPTDAQAVFDRKWTEEAVCNLLDNAVKYTPAGGHVTLRAIPYEMFCRIDVTDDGPGIPEEEQPRLFARFYRGQSHAGEEGVGVGLTLVRQIAGGQGGYVKVSSRPGEGATFSLFLPRG